MSARFAGTALTCLMLSVCSSIPAHAQWLHYRDPNTPRLPDGKPNMSAPISRTADRKPDLSGVWRTMAVPNLPVRPVGTPDNLMDRLIGDTRIPLRPSAEALFTQRSDALGAGRPSQLCLPHGIPDAMLITGMVFKFVPAQKMWVILYEEFNHFRQVMTDGRTLPVDPEPTWLGYSVGHWDGDTFVVESSGFNDQTWLDDIGHPHTAAMRTTERFRRKDFGHMEVDVTIDDPQAYTKPWTARIQLELLPDTDLLENICEDERDTAHIAK